MATYRLVFSCMIVEWLGWSDVAAVLGEMRGHAVRADVTGVALHDGKRFLFVVEGSFAAASARHEAVRTDPRLTEVTLIESAPIADRSFANWDSACQEVSTVQDARWLAAEVADLAEPVRDPVLRRLLLGFVRPHAISEMPVHRVLRSGSLPKGMVAANACPPVNA